MTSTINLTHPNVNETVWIVNQTQSATVFNLHRKESLSNKKKSQKVNEIHGIAYKLMVFFKFREKTNGEEKNENTSFSTFLFRELTWQMKSEKANVNVTQFSLWTNQKKRRHASSSHIQQSYFLNKNSWKQYLQYRPILILSQSHMLEPKAGEISHQYNFFELDYGEKESINKWINYK